MKEVQRVPIHCNPTENSNQHILHNVRVWKKHWGRVNSDTHIQPLVPHHLREPFFTPDSCIPSAQLPGRFVRVIQEIREQLQEFPLTSIRLYLLQVQCHTLTGYCWCVTTDGKPVSGSSVQNKTPVCSGTVCMLITSLDCLLGLSLCVWVVLKSRTPKPSGCTQVPCSKSCVCSSSLSKLLDFVWFTLCSLFWWSQRDVKL